MSIVDRNRDETPTHTDRKTDRLQKLQIDSGKAGAIKDDLLLTYDHYRNSKMMMMMRMWSDN